MTSAVANWIAVAIGAAALLVDPAVAQQCAGPNLENGADRCFATAGCAWNGATSMCQSAAMAPANDALLSFDNGHVVGKRNGAVASPLEFNEIGRNRKCPNSLVRYVEETNIPLDLTTAVAQKIPSPTDWLNWAGSVPDKLKIREAWLSLRHDGTCRAAILAHSVPASLVMSDQATINWGLAKRGNPFLGVIDCESWKVYLLPTQARNPNAPAQVQWDVSQLKGVRWVGGGPAPGYSPDDLAYHALRGADHGWAALTVSRIIVSNDRSEMTLARFCELEVKVKSNFLGFTVWPKLSDGLPEFVYSSRQLNGPNLDTFELSGEAKDDGWILPTTTLIDKRGGQSRPVYDANGNLVDGIVRSRGELTPELQAALRKMGDTLPPRP